MPTHGPSQPLIRKWYFAINGRGYTRQYPLIHAAINSARANTDLQPICLYGGDNPNDIKTMEAMGVTVIPHVSSLTEILRNGYGDLYEKYSGHWLRLDIPLLEQEDTYVLYTDIDVMFLGPPRVAFRPKYLAAAPERYRWRWPVFNSGIMVLNVPNMRNAHDAFVARIAKRMAKGWHPPGHDQVSYNQSFRWQHTHLPHVMNWKPYWGIHPDARIVHFHGPKPRAVQRLARGEQVDMGETQRALWNLDRPAYAHYAKLWHGYRK